MHILRRHWLAIVIIAIGSGAAAAVAAAHHRLFAEALPYVDADRIVMVPGAMVTYSGGARRIHSWIEEASEFASLGLYQGGPVTVSTSGGPQRVAAAAVGLDFFEVFRARAVWGRTLDPTDPAGVRYAVLSHDLGRHMIDDARSSPPTIRIDGLSFVVVGVMPEGFDFPNGARVWVPFQSGTQVTQGRGGASVVGRLAEGVSLADARRRIERGTGAIDWRAPGFDAVRTFRDELSRGVLPLLRTLMLFCVLLLLVTSVNVWGLGLVASTTTRHETAIRMAIGATRLQLLGAIGRQAGVLALCAAALGVVVAWLAWLAFGAVAASLAPNLDLRTFDWRLGGYALVSAVVATAGLAAGQAIPVLRLDSRASTLLAVARLKGASRGRRVLIAAQVAAAFILLSAAVASTEAVTRASHVDPGFGNPDAVSVGLSVPHARFESGEDLLRLAADIEGQIRDRLGSVSVGVTDTTTGEDGLVGWPLTLEGAASEPGRAVDPERPGRTNAIAVAVSAGYFEATGIPLLAGRLIGASDGPAARPNVVISAAAAQALGLAPAQAVGRLIDHFDSVSTVVGVVDDVRMFGPQNEASPAVYRPLGHRPRTFVLSAVVSGPGVTIPAVLAALHDLDPDIAAINPRIIGRYMEPFLAIPRVVQRLTSAAAIIAVLLAAIAIYGLLSYDVASRRRDIAVRLALGENRGAVARRYIWTATRITLGGVGVGLLLQSLVWSIAGSVTREVPPPTLASLSLGAFAMVVAALWASSRPALAAAAVDPGKLLKE